MVVKTVVGNTLETAFRKNRNPPFARRALLSHFFLLIRFFLSDEFAYEKFCVFAHAVPFNEIIFQNFYLKLGRFRGTIMKSTDV